MPTLRVLLFISILAVAVAGCGDDETPTAPDTPQRTPVTKTFTGVLTVNGGVTHSFASGSGRMRASLTALSPDSAATIGLSLGTFNGTACQIIIANDSATQAAAVDGQATTVGNFCVRVYDVGRLSAATEYTVTLEHFE
jgi:hypothetical protein